MTEKLTIAVAQLNPFVGAIDKNVAAILSAREQAAGADLLLTPELSVIGYPPEDLVRKPSFIAAATDAVGQLAQATADGGPDMMVGAPRADGDRLYNSIYHLSGGRIAGHLDKHKLPNYGVFDELRVFDSAPPQGPLNVRGVRLGTMICEDMWFPDATETLCESGAEILLVPTCSPFAVGKFDERLAQAVARIRESGLPLNAK